MKRRIKVYKNLFFEWDHDANNCHIGWPGGPIVEQAPDIVSATNDNGPTEGAGGFVPFKKVRLVGTVNPLKPPPHVETVLIGRALGQITGYLYGIGYRIMEDGVVEGEFLVGPRLFRNFEQFELLVRQRFMTE